nr:hypothetical protein [Hassalia byssoidea]
MGSGEWGMGNGEWGDKADKADLGDKENNSSFSPSPLLPTPYSPLPN